MWKSLFCNINRSLFFNINSRLTICHHFAMEGLKPCIIYVESARQLSLGRLPVDCKRVTLKIVCNLSSTGLQQFCCQRRANKLTNVAFFNLSEAFPSIVISSAGYRYFSKAPLPDFFKIVHLLFNHQFTFTDFAFYIQPVWYLLSP